MNKEEIIKEDWLKILEKKENHYNLREKLVIEEVKKEIIEKIKKMVKYRDLDRGGYNQALNDVLKVI